jgi:hypothetical protein
MHHLTSHNAHLSVYCHYTLKQPQVYMLSILNPYESNNFFKRSQSFRSTHKDRVCVHMFIRMSAYTYMSICVCTMFLKKKNRICYRHPNAYGLVGNVLGVFRAFNRCLMARHRTYVPLSILCMSKRLKNVATSSKRFASSKLT